MDINRALTDRLGNLVTEQFTVVFINQNTGELDTRTDDAIGLLGYTLPNDKIVSVTRA